jgi:hypothetical protein
MLDEVHVKRLPAMVLTTDGFGQGLGAAEYATLMENARFALVPGGRCAETIRLYDALEMGAIPITLRHSSSTSSVVQIGFASSTLLITMNCHARKDDSQNICRTEAKIKSICTDMSASVMGSHDRVWG